MPDRAEGDKSKAPNVSRSTSIKNAFKSDDYEPDMPPCSCAHHILTYLWKWGPTLSGTMGQMALTHDNLVACQSNTGIELSEWESETLVRLSREYMGESSMATKPDRKPPFQSADGARLRQYQMRQKMQTFLRD